jgi:hypothetical protein
MDRLRSGPVLQSVPEIARAIKRLDEVRELAKGLPHTDKLPKKRILALARFANAANSSAWIRWRASRARRSLFGGCCVTVGPLVRR